MTLCMENIEKFNEGVEARLCEALFVRCCE